MSPHQRHVEVVVNTPASYFDGLREPARARRLRALIAEGDWRERLQRQREHAREVASEGYHVAAESILTGVARSEAALALCAFLWRVSE